ncbi:hypothetical protein BC833DRAFT_587015 [Globomyces pollinis-pini]|nr:hypothetical protein BC833DRAFT_587015 [Globomyces pollinis-pini]
MDQLTIETFKAAARNNRKAQIGRRKQAGRTIYQKELQQIKELCSLMKKLAELQEQEVKFRRTQDLNELQELTDNSKMEDEYSIIGVEAVMSIINITVRKQSLKKRLFSKMMDEKELNTLMQTHKEDFTQFIWKRRLQTKKDLRFLFQSGPGTIGRFGDIIANNNLESIQGFERYNWARLCKDAINFGMCELEDIPGFFNQVCLQSPRNNSHVMISPSRLEFKVMDKNPEYHCVSATSGAWANKLYAKALIKDIMDQSLEQLMEKDGPNRDTDYTYAQFLAKVVDVLHPTHQLQASVLAFPLYGPQILKRRILQLGYDMSGTSEETSQLDYKFTMDVMKQMCRKVDKDMKCYYEFSVPLKANWRAGLISAIKVTNSNKLKPPGSDLYSFGFTPSGSIIVDGVEFNFMESLSDKATDNIIKTIGILIDLYAGCAHLVVEGVISPVAFGRGAMLFNKEEQNRQCYLITKHHIIPAFALMCSPNMLLAQERAILTVNFGSKPFTFSVNATPLCQIHQHILTKGQDQFSILDYGPQAKDSASQEEDEKINNALEKNYFKISLLPEVSKSFSQFPPSVYRRSLAATKIQRAYRRYQGRQMRKRIRKEQHVAACVIQRMARKKLRKIREVKNLAAAKIQKCWRRKLLIWVALLRCIYQQTIPNLHNAASTIQKKWRHWHMFRNSPLASKYQAKMEDLETAVNTIIKWWRPLYSSLVEIRQNRAKNHAATVVQRNYRGYKLRSLLRPDIREKLGKIGDLFVASGDKLKRLCAAYHIQRAWRNYTRKRIMLQKVKTRHLAATKIQANWKGFWVRTHSTLRFSYGEVIFLLAVRQSLVNCHFILKMYRPCGIVCPKVERNQGR